MLRYAVRRTGLTEDALCEQLGITPTRLMGWLDGSIVPTVEEAEALAPLAKLPFAMLTLDTPPHVLGDYRDARRRGSPVLTDVSLVSESHLINLLVCTAHAADYRRREGLTSAFLEAVKKPATTPTALLTLIEKRFAAERPGTPLPVFDRLKAALEKLDVSVMICDTDIPGASAPLDGEEFDCAVCTDGEACTVAINASVPAADRAAVLAAGAIFLAKRHNAVFIYGKIPLHYRTPIKCMVWRLERLGLHEPASAPNLTLIPPTTVDRLLGFFGMPMLYALTMSVASGQLPYTDFTRLTGVRPADVSGLAETLAKMQVEAAKRSFGRAIPK